MSRTRLFFFVSSTLLLATIVIHALAMNVLFHPRAASAVSPGKSAHTPPHIHFMRTRQAVVPSATSPLQYHNGPVMKTSTTYAIF